MPCRRGSHPRRRLAIDEPLRHTHGGPTPEVTGANVQGALSPLPNENAMREMLSGTHYLPAEALLGDLVSDGSLSRIQIELVAARASNLNECFY